MIRFDLMPAWTDLAEMTILPYKVMQAVLFNLMCIVLYITLRDLYQCMTSHDEQQILSSLSLCLQYHFCLFESTDLSFQCIR